MYGSVFDQRGQVVGRFDVGETEQSAGQLDDIASGPAAGKAVPEVFGGGDDEGARIVSAVQRAGSDESGLGTF